MVDERGPVVTIKRVVIVFSDTTFTDIAYSVKVLFIEADHERTNRIDHLEKKLFVVVLFT